VIYIWFARPSGGSFFWAGLIGWAAISCPE
jgi:hypothetical protein